MEMESKKKHNEYVISAKKANIYGLIAIIPSFLVIFLPYWFIWGSSKIQEAFSLSFGSRIVYLLLYLVMLLFGIFVHELVHGLFWSMYSENGWKDIEFGIKWKVLTPYTHCKAPLKVKEYIIGVIMPALLVGILPGIIAFLTGNVLILVFAIVFTIAAGGDFIMSYMLLKLDGDEMVEDHPDKVGFMISNKK